MEIGLVLHRLRVLMVIVGDAVAAPVKQGSFRHEGEASPRRERAGMCVCPLVGCDHSGRILRRSFHSLLHSTRAAGAPIVAPFMFY